jgi:hypothetical protein
MTTDPKRTLDRQYLEMRWRILSLAADFDRLDRAAGNTSFHDPRVGRLQAAVSVLLEPALGRAERVQLLLSDKTPVPEGRS